MEIVPFIMQLAALACLFFEAFRLFQGPGKPVWGWAGMMLWLGSLMVSIQLHPTN